MGQCAENKEMFHFKEEIQICQKHRILVGDVKKRHKYSREVVVDGLPVKDRMGSSSGSACLQRLHVNCNNNH